MGGIAGNAGLFSDAYDVAVVMQMQLQDGYYGGRQYIKPETVAKFNQRPFRSNRRGLGWDKPVIKGDGGLTSNYAPSQVFGHTGFTGTCAWADPKNNLVYVFLSNRVYPYAENKRLQRADVRENIQTVIYKAIGAKKQR
jgi:CubicO group peptidase (beta-lactamase class C family)